MRWLAAVLGLAAPVPALALSCLPHPIEAAFTQAAEAQDAFLVVEGTLNFDQTQMPTVDLNNQAATPAETRIAAHLVGALLQSTGFTESVSLDLTLVVACYGPWCPQAESGAPVLAFLRETANGYVVETNPCGGFLFQKPGPEMLARVVECHNGADCKPDAP